MTLVEKNLKVTGNFLKTSEKLKSVILAVVGLGVHRLPLTEISSIA